MKLLAIVLLILGVVGLVYGGIEYNRDRTVPEGGGHMAMTSEHGSTPFSPIVGGIAILAGFTLLVVERRRT